MIRPLRNTDLNNFIYFCQNRDQFSDFYITKNNRRLFLNKGNIARQVFKSCLKQGEKCFIKEENDNIVAVLLIIGYKDKDERKYLKILAKKKSDVQDLFSYFVWQKYPPNIFIKAHKNNTYLLKYDERSKKFKPAYHLRKAGFRSIAEREKEILIKLEPYQRNYKR